MKFSILNKGTDTLLLPQNIHVAFIRKNKLFGNASFGEPRDQFVMDKF